MGTHAATVSGDSSKADELRIGLTLAALGVVYGDIGTSPLYALRESLNAYSLPPTPENLFGILSLIFWALVIVVTLKYVRFVMRADNHGEGGVIALLALALRATPGVQARRILVTVGMLGAALFFGDGIITPAISVLSAVEGLEVATPLFTHYVLPITIVVLIALFAVQRHGTASVGRYFGAVMLLWFIVLALLGIIQIAKHPQVLATAYPMYAVRFAEAHAFGAFVTLGAVFLAVTGAEALYADMGHFGARPITVAWLYLVMPALLLNYFGQGALLIDHPEAVKNPFYLLAPGWGLYPLVFLATAATVIASQAVISGAFSIAQQAIQMGFIPRLRVIHTSGEARGQIYLPWINWFLLACIIGLVLGFKSSDNLAAAYGISVAGTMVATTFLMYFVARYAWGWSTRKALLPVAAFLVIDVLFFSANLLKFMDGGWFPITVALIVFTVMTTWKKGRDLIRERIQEEQIPLEVFVQSLKYGPPPRVPGTAVFMTTRNESVPHALLHNLKHNKVLHERVLLLTLAVEDVPRVDEKDRVEVVALPENFYRVTGRYGFMEMPDVPALMDNCKVFGLVCNMMETSFFLSRQQIQPTSRANMAYWRQKIFVALFKNAATANDFLQIPPNRVIELGARLEI